MLDDKRIHKRMKTCLDIYSHCGHFHPVPIGDAFETLQRNGILPTSTCCRILSINCRVRCTMMHHTDIPCLVKQAENKTLMT